MHLYLWGQNQLIWLLALLIDSELTRMMFFRSSMLTALIPYLGVPIYLFWLASFHLSDRDYIYHVKYVVASMSGWIVYMILMAKYSKNILASLYNYWMMLVAKDLREVLKERQEELGDEGDETTAFESGTDGSDQDNDIIIEEPVDFEDVDQGDDDWEWIFI